MDAVLPWPWEVVCLRSTGTQFQLGRAMPQPSLSQGFEPICQECLVRDQSGFRQQAEYSTNVQERQGFSLRGRAARLSSPRLKSGASRRDVVKEVVKQLCNEHNIYIRDIPSTKSLRVSTGFYNTEEEIDTLVRVLRAL